MVLLMYIIGLGLGYTIGTEFEKCRQRKKFSEIKKDCKEIKIILDRSRGNIAPNV